MGQKVDKKVKNEMFKVAVDHLYQEKLVGSQGELAEKIGISDSALSRIMNDKKFVSDDTLRKMNEAFGNIFNMAYFRGESTILLAKDAAYYQQHPSENPFSDFDKAPKQQAGSVTPVASAANIPDQASLMNATIAAQMESIESLKRELLTKDELIQSLRDQLAAKNQLIAEQKARLIDYRRIIDARNSLESYPFPIGAADSDNSQKPTRK